MEMAPPNTISTGGGGGDDAPDYDNSSCCSSSITAPDSCRSWISDVSSGSISSFRSAAADARTTSTASVITTRKPHKANQAEWESIRRLRALTSGRVGLDHFRLVRRLGSGDLGNVYLCRLLEPRLSGCFYAMKVVDREALAIRKKLQRAETEREILSMLDHPFLPTLYAHFDAAHYSCFVMEFCPGGDLHVARQRQPGRRFSLSSTRFYAAEILLALEYLHMMGVVYRDLKPENVLVRGDGHIMLSDFDLSLKCDVVPKLLRLQRKPNEPLSGKKSSRHSTTSGSTSSSSCVMASPMQPVLSCLLGTGGSSCRRRTTTTTITTAAAAEAAAAAASSKEEEDDDDDGDGGSAEQEDELLKVYHPEMVAEPVAARSKSFVGTHEYLAPEVISGLGHGSAVDWWTLGVFLYELLYGRTPFKGEDNENTMINIIKQPLRFPKTMVGSQRELEEMVAAQDLIGKLLVKNPKRRIGSLRGSVEIKRNPFFKGVNWALIRSIKPPEVPMQNISSKITTAISNIGKSSCSGVRRRDGTYQLPQYFDYF